MTNRKSLAVRAALLISLLVNLTVISTRIEADTGMCGGASITLPFTDVPSSNLFFCSIASAYFSGLTNGTSATTFSPGLTVNREQMAAFTSRTLDQAIKRGNRRAALNQWWSPKINQNVTASLDRFHRVQSDGTDLFTSGDEGVLRLRASDGTAVAQYSLPAGVQGRGVLLPDRRFFVAGYISPGTLPGRLFYQFVNISTAPMLEYTTSIPLPVLLDGLAFDGQHIWVGSQSQAIARVALDGPHTTTIITGFSQPRNVTYDGANIWVSEFGTDKVHKLDTNGAILHTVTVGANPLTMAFDGTNLWVPNYGSNSVSVVRVKDGSGNPLAAPFVVATLTGNGLSTPSAVAFDGERMLVTNENAHSVSVFRAADLAPLATVSISGVSPVGACSNAIHFFITGINSIGQGILMQY